MKPVAFSFYFKLTTDQKTIVTIYYKIILTYILLPYQNVYLKYEGVSNTKVLERYI